jgi:hypothetical protein
MFPTGRPGYALLLMRAALGLMVLAGVIAPLASREASPFVLLLAWVAVISLAVGVLTPVTSLLCVVLELFVWRSAGGDLEVVHVCSVITALALALLGPGGYSVDARLFGRRQVIFRSGDDSNR